MHRIYRNARISLDATTTQEKREILRALGEAALAEHAECALMHRVRPIEPASRGYPWRARWGHVGSQASSPRPGSIPQCCHPFPL